MAVVFCFSLPLTSRSQEKFCNLAEPPAKQLTCLLDSDSTRTLRSLLERESNDAIYFNEIRKDAGLNLYRAGVRMVDKGEPILVTYFVIHTFSVRAQDEETGDGIHWISSPDKFTTPFDVRINADGEGFADFQVNYMRGAPVLSQSSQVFPSWRAPTYRAIHVGLELPRELVSSSQRITFTREQVRALAALYLYASSRSGKWLIPVFHNKVEVAFQNSRLAPDFLASLDDAISEAVEEAENPLKEKAYQEYHALEEQLGLFDDRFKEQVRGLKQVERISPAGALVKGYDSNEVAKIYRDSKAELIERLNLDVFAGLRAYVRKYYPLPDTPVVGQNQESCCSSVVNVVYKSKASGNQLGLISSETLGQFVSRVLSFSAKLNKSAIDLQVNSMPDGATVRLTAEGGARATGNTNSQITNLFRGYYNYTVTKEGFKSITQELNLVDARGTKLVCTLDQIHVGSCVLK